ncbi:MAG: hypothetical protein BIFFINMI_01551 [Phycisphaerae bacterium]|nr:hypothetical protein [Phycisphaerae bacterium]
MTQGRVLAVLIATDKAGPTVELKSVQAVPGRGLEGDRYFSARGTFDDVDKKTGSHDPGREVTLVAVEALEAAAAAGVALTHADTRRNLLTRGVPLNDLVGREFTVGPVRLRGIRLCHPCGHMEKLIGKAGAEAALLNRGGLRAEILTPGTLRPGDTVTAD